MSFKKYVWICLPILAVVVAAAALLLIFLPADAKLTITAGNVEMTEDEEVELKYEVSKPFAIVRFEVKDDNVLKIVNFKLSALKAGETTLKLKASLNGESAECEVAVLIKQRECTLPPDLEDEENPPAEDNNPSTPDKPSTPNGSDNSNATDNPKPDETDKPDEADKPDGTKPDEAEKPETPDKPDEGDTEEDSETELPDGEKPSEEMKELEFLLCAEFGCKAEGKVLVVKAGKKAHFVLVIESEVAGITLSGEGIELSESELGGGMWQVVARSAGRIYIQHNGKTVGQIEVVVE